MILLSHPTGNANVRQAALALHASGQLAEFWTCFAVAPDAAFLRWIPRGLRTQLSRRALSPELMARVRTAPLRELGRMAASRLGWPALVRPEIGPFSIDAVYRALDRRVSHEICRPRLRNLRGVYAYEDGALETFRACRERGFCRWYDLPIGYWRVWKTLVTEEALREPAWAATLQGFSDCDEKLARKDQELRLADRVFVASSFTRQTLASSGVPDHLIQTIPYGAPSVRTSELEGRASGPLRVLFVGALSQRKGLSYLLRAVEMLKGRVTLTLIGARPEATCPALETALRQHRWIPSLPHEEILAEMRQQDVFVFPSLFEGFGLVILEALSQGLPVITTPHTGGPDIITEGGDGFIVSIRSAEAIAEHLEMLASDDGRLREMKHAALAKAATLRWSAYREKLAASVTMNLVANPGIAA